MPTVLYLRGWRFYFYSNERMEPPHIHVSKGDAEGKFWLDAEMYDVRTAFTYRIGPAELRFIRKTLFNHFDDLLEAWNDIHGGLDL